ncbi:MAG: hypothetical protein RI990_637, partial [Planctomycetota bacterium]
MHPVGANLPPATAATIDARTAPRLAGAIAGAWAGTPDDPPAGGSNHADAASPADARCSRTQRVAAAVASVMGATALLFAADSWQDPAHDAGRRGSFRGSHGDGVPLFGQPAVGDSIHGDPDMRTITALGAAAAASLAAMAHAQVGQAVQWRVEDGG